MGKPYRMPDSKTAPAAALVHVYKNLVHVSFNDRVWDALYFPRFMRRAKFLLERFDGNFEMAQLCLQELSRRFRAAGLCWTFETVCAFSVEWKAHHEKMKFKAEATQMFGQRGEGSELSQADPMKVLEAMMR